MFIILTHYNGCTIGNTNIITLDNNVIHYITEKVGGDYFDFRAQRI